jgi:D-amino-acid dehydrogenase
MDMTTATHPVPDRVVVIGAGMVGLSTAWFLQEHGVQVTVLDRTGVAAGSSWGNAGWLTPGVATPLPEPAVLRYGLRAALSPSSPVYVPPSLKPALLRFLTGFVRHSTTKAWRTAMGHLVGLNDLSLESFDRLERGGVQAETHAAGSFLAAYRTEAERTTLLEEIQHIHAAGQDIEFEALTGDQARTIEPHLSQEIGAAILLRGQRFIDPGRYLHALAESVSDRGGKIIDSATV